MKRFSFKKFWEKRMGIRFLASLNIYVKGVPLQCENTVVDPGKRKQMFYAIANALNLKNRNFENLAAYAKSEIFVREFFMYVSKRDPVYEEFNSILHEKFKNRIPEGELIGYKKALYDIKGFVKQCIVKLRIPADAYRSKAFGKKCRCNKAYVEDIYTIPDKCKAVRHISDAYSFLNNKFTYTVGQTVEVKIFDTCPWVECSSGIHFFENEQDAIRYVI